MRFLVIITALLLNTQAFATGFADCLSAKDHFVIWMATAVELKRTGLPCNAHIEAAEAMKEWFDYSLHCITSADERQQWESKLRDELLIVTDEVPECHGR